MRQFARRTIETLRMMNMPSGLGYHTIEHVEEVYQGCMKQAAQLMARGVAVDLEVLAVGAMAHDVGYALFWQGVQIEEQGVVRIPLTPEELSCSIKRVIERRYHASEEFMGRTDAVVMGTQAGTTLETIEQMILAAQDLRGAAGPYEQFAANSRLLHQESNSLRAAADSWRHYVGKTIALLGRYTERSIKLSPEFWDEQRRSSWHVGTIANMTRLARQVWQRSYRTVVDYGWVDTAPASFDVSVPHFTNTEAYVVVRPTMKQGRRVLAATKERYQQIGAGCPMLIGLEHAKGALSLPDESVDELLLLSSDAACLLLATGASANEFIRVIRPFGTVNLYSGASDTVFGTARSVLAPLTRWMKEGGFQLDSFRTDRGFPEAVYSRA